MSFLGTSWEDPKTAAIMGVAQGLLGGNLGAGLQMGLQGHQRQSQLNRENARQDKADRYSEEKHAAELAALKRAALTDAALGRAIFGDNYESMVSGQSPATRQPSAGPAATLGAQPGGMGQAPASAAPMDGQPRLGGMFSNLDRDAVMADYLINKGKNLPEWLNKRNTPDMQVSNGFAYDKNRVQPGFMPSINTSANGQTTVTMPDGQGGVRVQAPTGALDTYSAYLTAQERAKAGYDLVEVPASDGTKRTMPRSDAIAATTGAATAAPRAYPTAGNAFINDEVRGLIEADAARNGISNPTIRMNMGTPGQTLGLARSTQIGVTPAAPSAVTTKQGEAYGKDLGDFRAEINRAGFTAPSTLAKLGRMESLLQGVEGGRFAPMGAEVASAAKSMGLNIDPKLGNKEAAQALAVEMALGMRQPGTGAFTDKDFDNFMSAVPGLAKTAEGRAQITATLRAKAQRDIEISKMAREYARRNGGALDDGFFDQVSQYVADNPLIPQTPQGQQGGNGGLSIRRIR